MLLISLVAGVIATYLIVVTAGVKERHWDELRQAANVRIAESDQRAAEAQAKAAEAELALIEFRRPRRIGSEQSQIIIDRIKPYSGTRFDIGHVPDDREQMDFLWAFEPVLPKAGWVHIDWAGGQMFTKPNWPGDHMYGRIAVLNVAIEIHPESLEKLSPAAEALVAALNEIGITAAITAFNNSSLNVDALHVMIGPKR